MRGSPRIARTGSTPCWCRASATARVAGGCSTLRGIPIPGTFNYRLPLNPRAWSRALQALQPDVIEVGDAFHTAWAARGVADRLGLPLVAFYHSNLPHLVGRRYGEIGPARGGALRARHLCRASTGCSRRAASCATPCASLGVEQVRHQPLGVDPEIFHPARRTRDLRAELGLARGSRLLVFAGRFSQEKRIDVLRDAFRRLGKAYQLVLLGGAETRQLDENVCALPFRSDSRELASWLASADALVHAGTEETFGLVVLEAMACGTAGGRDACQRDSRTRQRRGRACWRGRTTRRTSRRRSPDSTTATRRRWAARRARACWRASRGRTRSRRC